MTKCIFIVDDNQSVRRATRFLLESQSEFEVCGEAEDGIDALEQASHLSPDLIILDLAMPRMNGLETARELRARSCLAPIILFTMHAESVRPEDASSSGVNAVVSKMDLSNLQLQIRTLLVMQ